MMDNNNENLIKKNGEPDSSKIEFPVLENAINASQLITGTVQTLDGPLTLKLDIAKISDGLAQIVVGSKKKWDFVALKGSISFNDNGVAINVSKAELIYLPGDPGIDSTGLVIHTIPNN